MQSSRLVQAVFALLVVATVAAFFITQSLKTEVPVVLRFAAKPRDISPNGDRVRDSARVGFDLSEPAEISFYVIDSEGNEVRQLVEDRRLAGDTKHRFAWDGRDDDGQVVPDGVYRLRVARRKEGRVVDSFKKVRVDTRRPNVRLESATPNVLSPVPGGARRVRVAYSGPRNVAPEFRVFRTDVNPPKVVRLFRGDRSRSGVWDGTVRGGGFAPDGSYSFFVLVRDLAGNLARAPAPDPPRASTSAPRTGVDVRRLTLEGPAAPVSAGSIATFQVGPVERRFEFALSRLGSERNIRRDRRRGGRLRVRIPRGAHTGVYLVRVRAGGRRAVWPVAVAGLPATSGAANRPRPLVVLPAVTWQGLNRWDSDLDGFPDTLESSRSIPADRPYAGGGPPPRFAAEASPLLRFLDREHLAYDITTDVALARGEGPAIENAPGVAIAGTARWLPRRVRDRLRDEVEARGLRVASFGVDSLKRTVALVGDRLRDPSPPRRDDLFGERTVTFRTEPPAPLREERDQLNLFRGVDDLFGEFSVFERSVALPEDADLRTAAGREEGKAAFVAYSLGKGIVIRPGTPGWVAELEEGRLSVEVPRITRRIWALISHER